MDWKTKNKIKRLIRKVERSYKAKNKFKYYYDKSKEWLKRDKKELNKELKKLNDEDFYVVSSEYLGLDLNEFVEDSKKRNG